GGSTACLRGANQRVPKSPIYRNFGGKSEPLSPSPSPSRGGWSTRSGDRAGRARRSWPRRSNSLAAPTRLRPGGLSHPPRGGGGGEGDALQEDSPPPSTATNCARPSKAVNSGRSVPVIKA